MPQSVALDATMLQTILEAALQNKPTYPDPDAPRVGGVNSTGAWTGFGAADDATSPRTNLCMRKLKMSESRAYQRLIGIEENVAVVFRQWVGPSFV